MNLNCPWWLNIEGKHALNITLLSYLLSFLSMFVQLFNISDLLRSYDRNYFLPVHSKMVLTLQEILAK